MGLVAISQCVLYNAMLSMPRLFVFQKTIQSFWNLYNVFLSRLDCNGCSLASTGDFFKVRFLSSFVHALSYWFNYTIALMY